MTTTEQTELEPQSTYRMALADATRTRHLAGVTCFCPDTAYQQETGHPLNAPGCQAKVTAGTYPSRSRNAPSHPRPSAMSADIYSALAKAAKTPAERKRWKALADIAKSADREHSAQEVGGGSERARAIRLKNLPAGTPSPQTPRRAA